MIKFNKTHEKALNNVNNIINSLKNDRMYYDADFECEYTPFEEDIKIYCESYCEFYMENNRTDLFFDSLKRIVNAMFEYSADMYEEDFFRTAELITYYFGKIISTDEDIKDIVHDWILDFCRENKGDMIVEDYFNHFIKGEKIHNSDSYYTNYSDFNRMILVFK